MDLVDRIGRRRVAGDLAREHHITIDPEGEEPMTSGAGVSWEAPTEHGSHWIEIELDHPVNPSEHEGAGSVTWGANLDRLAPLGEEAVSIIKEAWEHRGANPHDQVERERKESERVDRVQTTGASIKPGWAGRIDHHQYWIHLTLYQPINER